MIWKISNETNSWDIHSFTIQEREDQDQILHASQYLKMLGDTTDSLSKDITADDVWDEIISNFQKNGDNNDTRIPSWLYGRYASESVTIDNHTVILGGIIDKGNVQEVTSNVRMLGKDGWTNATNCKMEEKRGLFCTVKQREGSVVNIGGI